MSLTDLLAKTLSGGAVDQIAGSIGADSATTSRGVTAALPALLGAMSKNAASPDGAQALAGALDRDHDGSVLDNLGGLLSGGGAGGLGGLLGGLGGGAPAAPTAGAGDGILKHLLGGQREEVAQQVGAASGMDSGSANKLLGLLAPIVMGFVGKQKREQGLDAGGLMGMLSGLAGGGAASAPGGAGALGALNSMLDKDGDGSAMDDVAGIVGGLFGK